MSHGLWRASRYFPGPCASFPEGSAFQHLSGAGTGPSSVLALVDEPSGGWALMRGKESSCPWLSCSCVWF